jgi:sporulation protein YlmC with PRC-barrel domain
MTPRRLRLLTEVLDLQIMDSRMHDCGIVDDIELEGGPGEGLRVKALLVGPGAYRARLPRWAMELVKLVAGDRCVAVPWREIEEVTAIVWLKRPAESYGLNVAEARARRLLARTGGMDAPQ